MDDGRRISDRTIRAVTEVISEELDVSPYAWKIHDKNENRVWLSLSQSEAEEWESITDAEVTIVAWQIV